MSAKSTDLLLNWTDIADDPWDGLLVGNGASVAVWDRFGYGSLYETACSNEIEHPLSQADTSLFQAFGTRNFEQILASILTARQVDDALGIDTTEHTARYGSIRLALIDAVHHVHVPWALVPDEVLQMIREAVGTHKYVYSTNYDLLIYWAAMHETEQKDEKDSHGFKDYFWVKDDEDARSTHFDMRSAQAWGAETRVLYLHGALHLFRRLSGEAHKRINLDSGSILDQFGAPLEEGDVPLIITEGTPENKLASIHQSDYLAHAYTTFAEHRGSLVVFGHSLGPSDSHLVDVINGRSWEKRTIAISLRNTDPAAVTSRMAGLRALLPKANLLFFDAATHPLGSADLRIDPTDPLGYLNDLVKEPER